MAATKKNATTSTGADKASKKSAASKATKKAAATKGADPGVKGGAKAEAQKATGKKSPAKKTKGPSTKGKSPATKAKTSAAAKPDPDKKTGAALAAEKLLEEKGAAAVVDLGVQMLGDNDAAATKSARVMSEVLVQKVEATVPLVDRFVAGLRSTNKRVVQTSADALPAIAKVAPARVAKHLDKLKASFGEATLPAKDGLVRTFAALCFASVAYQRRLEPVLKEALGEADPKTLIQWTEGVLPALKGEPHANARAVVEERLASLPKAPAQHLADFLGVNLRHHRLR